MNGCSLRKKLRLISVSSTTRRLRNGPRPRDFLASVRGGTYGSGLATSGGGLLSERNADGKASERDVSEKGARVLHAPLDGWEGPLARAGRGFRRSMSQASECRAARGSGGPAQRARGGPEVARDVRGHEPGRQTARDGRSASA